METVPETRIDSRRSSSEIGLLLIWTGIFVIAMAYYWAIWPDASLLFGPFWIVRYNGLDPCTGFGIFLLLAVLFTFPAKPGVLTAIVSLCGFLLWCAAGAVGMGIGC
jgi:hypothetical protein